MLSSLAKAYFALDLFYWLQSLKHLLFFLDKKCYLFSDCTSSICYTISSWWRLCSLKHLFFLDKKCYLLETQMSIFFFWTCPGFLLRVSPFLSSDLGGDFFLSLTPGFDGFLFKVWLWSLKLFFPEKMFSLFWHKLFAPDD